MAKGTGCEAPKACLAKIVMVGDSFVGKTSILRRYTDFCTTGCAPPSSYITTVGIDFKVKTISCDNTTMKLQIWDTAGQERFHTFTTSFFRGAHGFVLVYDITDGKSFQGISHWMKDIYEACLQQYKNSITIRLESFNPFFIIRVNWISPKSPQLGESLTLMSKAPMPTEKSQHFGLPQKVGENTDIILLGNKCDKEAERIISKNKGEKLAWEYGIPFFETSAKDNINIENAFSVLAKEILNKNSCESLNLDVVDLNEKLQTRSCCKL